MPNDFTHLSRSADQKKRTNDKNEEKQKSCKKSRWRPPLYSFHFTQSVNFNKYELNTIRLWIRKSFMPALLRIMTWSSRKKTSMLRILWSQLQALFTFFWQTLCHSNRLRKIWTKNALFPLASFFFFGVSWPLFSEAAGVAQGAPLPFVHHRKLPNYAWNS